MNPQYEGRLRDLKWRTGRCSDFGNTLEFRGTATKAVFRGQKDPSLRPSLTTTIQANFEGNDYDECLLDCCESLIEIVHDVFDVFDSYGDADHSIRDADLFSSLFAERAVRHGGRV